jgi:hypothetical protein
MEFSSLNRLLCRLQPWQDFFDTSKPLRGMPWTAKVHQILMIRYGAKTATIAKQDLKIRQSLLLKEQKLICTVLNRNVAFSNENNNFCPVLPSFNNAKSICAMSRLISGTRQSQRI